MSSAVESIICVAILIAWIAGVVLAAGWWKLLAALFPFYAWYLVIERLIQGAA